MANKNLTIFQKLGQVISPDGIKPKQQQPSTQRYNIGSGELLKTDNKAEYETAKLQAQQNKYLGSVWKKVESGLFQQSINYETTRIGSYADFEAMEFYPTIAAALDVMMEESTTLNDQGKMLNIYSDSKRVKTILEDLFFNRLDFHTSGPMWTRNTPIREDSIIPLLDGTEVTIKELSNRVKNGEEIWSYAIQDGTKAIVPSKIIWCDLTRKNSELYRVTLDDGTYIDTTPDHEYMLRDGSYKRADALTEGQSLMPFYTRKSEKKKDCIVGYEKIYNPSTTKYKFTHSLVAHECVRDLVYETSIGCQFDTHHNDFNKLNNNPSNLIRMTHSDHFKLHIEHFDKILGSPEVIKKRMEGIDRYLRSDKRKERLSKEMSGIYPKYFKQYNNSELHTEHNEIRSEKMLTNWNSDEFIEKTKKGMTIVITDECLTYISNIIKNSENYIGINKLSELLKNDDDFIQLFKFNYLLRKDIKKSINPTTLNKVIFRKTNQNYFDFVLSIKPNLILDKAYIKAKSIYLGKTKEKPLLNHKVVSVIKLNETSDVYCLEAVGPNGEHDRHNFPVLGKDITGLYSRTSGVFLSNCKYGDNFVYLNIDANNGIIGTKQMPNYEMERRESGLFDMISGRELQDEEISAGDKVKFFWRGRDVEFNSWQIAHFRLLGDDRRLPYGTCLKGDTRVNTEFGVEEISKIEVGTNVWSFNTKTQEKELSPILDKIMSGTKEVFKISTRHNFIDASKEHRILVALKSGEFIYKNVKELKLGDLLVINQKEKTNKLIKIDKTTPIDNKNGWFNNIDLIPDYVNEEIAQLFGFLIGDGWIPKHNSSVDFALGIDEQTNNFYINLLEKYSGKKIIRKNNQAKCHSKLLKTILERLGFNGKSYEKRIPKWVFEMDTDFQKAFVSGLIDADGWITKDKWTIAIHIELNNKPLIEDLKILLQRIGYKSGSIRSRIRKNPIIDGRQIKKVKESHMITFFDKNLNQMIVNDINGRLNYEYVLEPIQSIESIGEFETYDIYVENENHNFYANNIVVHNSVLEKARRIWKQLLLSEDSMLVYRVTRAPERRVYKIFVGNIDDADVEPYVNAIADRFKRMPIVDPQTGQIDLRYNQLANDQDFFIPVRDENAPNPIDTLPGASNLDQIADIEYLRSNLFTALRVPKPFLGFDDATGDGKNLAIQDIRFSRTINRIQQSILQELNKIAIIHLYLLGFEDDLDNFTLTLNNPSTQAEMLKVEHLQLKVSLLKDAVSDIGTGFGVMSWTRAHREIMGWSDDEIKQDLLEQRMEKAASAELANTAAVIKHTGMFDSVDRIYGDFDVALNGGGSGEGEEGGDSGAGGGGGFGGGGMGGEDLDFGDESDAEGEEGVPEEGAIDTEGGLEVDAEPETVAESLKKVEKLLTERKEVLVGDLNKRTNKYKNRFVDALVETIKPDKTKKVSNIKIYNKNLKINKDIDGMIGDIDKMLDE